MQGANAQQKEQLEHVAAAVALDNLELACAFIQKSAVEKCLIEIDKRLFTVMIVVVTNTFHYESAVAKANG